MFICSMNTFAATFSCGFAAGIVLMLFVAYKLGKTRKAQ